MIFIFTRFAMIFLEARVDTAFTRNIFPLIYIYARLYLIFGLPAVRYSI